MLRQATVGDLITGKVSREKGYVVITMRRYPRFIRRELRDEYLISLSPDRKLFEDWISAKRAPAKSRRMHHKSKRFPTDEDHRIAFDKVKFEKRFSLSDEGMAELKRLSKMKGDVYLVCQCHEGCRCHREMLLLLAKELFKARAEKPKNKYPVLEKRIAHGDFEPGSPVALSAA